MRRTDVREHPVDVAILAQNASGGREPLAAADGESLAFRAPLNLRVRPRVVLTWHLENEPLTMNPAG